MKREDDRPGPEEPADLEGRIAALVRRFHFEPIRDPAEMKRRIETEVRAEIRRAIASGELPIADDNEVEIEVRLGDGQAAAGVEVRIDHPAGRGPAN